MPAAGFISHHYAVQNALNRLVQGFILSRIFLAKPAIYRLP